MKFELDTSAKTVKLLEDATLGEVSEVLDKLLGEEAKKFKIVTVVNNYNPVVVGQPYYVLYRPWWLSGGRYVTTGGATTGGAITLQSGGAITLQSGGAGCTGTYLDSSGFVTLTSGGTGTAFLCESGNGNGLTVTNLSSS